jgi:hypothetical protein
MDQSLGPGFLIFGQLSKEYNFFSESHLLVYLATTHQGGGGTRIPNQGSEGGGGVRPKAKKIIVTSPILIAEVVVEELRMVLLEFKMSRC